MGNTVMEIIAITGLAVVAGMILDLLLGDPAFLPHPVVLMGNAVSRLEKKLRGVFPKTEKGELAAGRIMAWAMVLSVFTLTSLISVVSYAVSPVLFFWIQTVWCWQTVAIKDLAKEAKGVYRYLAEEPDLEKARKQVSRIVGRDTQDLSEEGVTKAVIETVAENFSDGVAAPVFYMMIGGGPLAMTYKCINTMDSMVGYKNEKYLYFGRAGAHMDDAAGFLPSRIAALLWIAAAFFTGRDYKNAWRIWRRDRFNHASPNSAQTESACAGALDVQLLGPAYYFGEYYDKPTVGDPIRPVRTDDILSSVLLLYAASMLAYAVGTAIRFAVIFPWLTTL